MLAARLQLIAVLLLTGSATTKEQGTATQDRGMLQPSALLRATTDNPASVNGAANSNIVACGVTAQIIDVLAPHGSAEVTVSLLPLCKGTQQLSGLVLQGSHDGRIYDGLQPFEVLVTS